jgi:hypothetical protein
MNDNNENLMERYGITAKQSTVYMYLGRKYDKLQDALNYAKIVAAREQSSVIKKKSRRLIRPTGLKQLTSRPDSRRMLSDI